jgi:hypothetical protein
MDPATPVSIGGGGMAMIVGGGADGFASLKFGAPTETT